MRLEASERAFVEEMVGKARRGVALSGAEKRTLRRAVERCCPRAEAWSWRTVVKLAIRLVEDREEEGDLVEVLAGLVDEDEET